MRVFQVCREIGSPTSTACPMRCRPTASSGSGVRRRASRPASSPPRPRCNAGRQAARRPARLRPAEPAAAEPLRLHVPGTTSSSFAASAGRRRRRMFIDAAQGHAGSARPRSRRSTRSRSARLFDRVLSRCTRTTARSATSSRIACRTRSRRRGPQQRAHADEPGRPDAADGQPHGRQLPELRRLPDPPARLLQQELFDPRSGFTNWRVLLESRNALHLLEDTCEDRGRHVEWIDALAEWPETDDAACARDASCCGCARATCSSTSSAC